MSADTPSVGYPVHAVATFVRIVNPHGVRFVDWTAQCGATGTMTGRDFGRAGSARKGELCRSCFPAGHNSCKIDQPQDLTPPFEPEE